jgi:hypothetical protein
MTKDDTKVLEAKDEKDEVIETGVARAFSGTHWIIRADMQGFEYETVPLRFVNAGSIVAASITEVNNNDVPFQGAASMEVHNVVPMNARPGEVGGRIRVRGFIGFDRNLRFKVSFMVAN